MIITAAAYEQLQLSRWMIGGERSATAGVSMAG